MHGHGVCGCDFLPETFDIPFLFAQEGRCSQSMSKSAHGHQAKLLSSAAAFAASAADGPWAGKSPKIEVTG